MLPASKFGPVIPLAFSFRSTVAHISQITANPSRGH